jgi:hypothetical protein
MPSAGVLRVLGNAVGLAVYRTQGTGGRVIGGGGIRQAEADHDFAGQELELKLGTRLTGEIGRLPAELHDRRTR